MLGAHDAPEEATPPGMDEYLFEGAWHDADACADSSRATAWTRSRNSAEQASSPACSYGAVASAPSAAAPWDEADYGSEVSSETYSVTEVNTQGHQQGYELACILAHHRREPIGSAMGRIRRIPAGALATILEVARWNDNDEIAAQVAEFLLAECARATRWPLRSLTGEAIAEHMRLAMSGFMEHGVQLTRGQFRQEYAAFFFGSHRRANPGVVAMRP